MPPKLPVVLSTVSFPNESISAVMDGYLMVLIITRQVVQDEIGRLKKNIFPGHDKILAHILNEWKEVFSGPLADISKMPVNCGYVPRQLKVIHFVE